MPVDPTPTCPACTLTTTVTPQADIVVTKTSTLITGTPGLPFTYTITALNLGPSDAPIVTITDNVPAELLGVTWTCAACAPASGSGNAIQTFANLDAGGVAILRIYGTLDPNTPACKPCGLMR